MMMKHLLSLSRDSFKKYFSSIGEKEFKATQVFEWIYDKKVLDSSNWSNFKNETREQIKKDFKNNMIKIVKKEEDDLTKKYLFKLEDNNHVEAVLMRHDYGLSVCVSSQVGCNMGCSFCESGRLKKVRNLETYEMVEQILLIEKDVSERISSVVIMGIGEPFDNYDNVIEFIKVINDDKGLAIGARHITVSTCGIIPKIKEFMNLPLQINLAISLHASNNELRSKIMPINKVYSLSQLLSTIDEYIAHTNRRVTIEYVMLNNVNDNENNAEELISLFKGKNVYINLIPYNETSHIIYKKSPKDKIMKFYDTLKKGGINVTIRKEFGSKISAACGQLRSKEVK
ncbi:MAG: 23S rRNA (adenine(2503)-C(2))-methyltransferase RlmN [Bacilli bacterium]|nr:23S rRNA (adenine(2503)-C(2))-methyltransferase RlmN [Bacilli bacterium]